MTTNLLSSVAILQEPQDHARPDDEVGQAEAGDGRSAETARLYAGDWAAFRGWCGRSGAAVLPAAPATVAGYLAQLAERVGSSALARQLSAINAMHRQHALPAPGSDPAVKAVLRAARRAPRPPSSRQWARPPNAARLVRAALSCPGDLAGTRDRALLLLAAATGRSRAALLGLDAEHVRITGGGLELLLATGPLGSVRAGQGVAVPRAAVLRQCPVRALQDWLLASDCHYGPVFRKVDRWGNVEHRRLGPDAIRTIWQRREAVLRRRRRAPKAGS